ncbi:hypothetical protein SAMN06265795_104235 [Noviherbaspirillum humi]|uniref:Alpha/beta hydrolase n=1 Tax=Noviherbaspirillum humi TaxID=1688639 RepID=A0A239G6N1_9BURK|nr:alpha/beta hydrolase [Noviherbaspirillum humi]SNS63704.1 hypothetical protein SAMN06265795_104235 [Noviherbaspirillum humi]
MPAAFAAEPAKAEPAPQEEARAQDSRVFTVDEAALPFSSLPGSSVETDRWTGILNGAGYRIEVPKNWNGRLVMYAHGFAEADPRLVVNDPPIRRHLIERGYAWAASSFSRNNYDVRAGIEDTNALAAAFTAIAAGHGRALAAPNRTYIVGGSMGGHVAAAAVERETQETAVNKYRYHGALSLCGVVGDTELLSYFTAYQMAAQYLGGAPAAAYPVSNFAAIEGALKDRLWNVYPLQPTEAGRKLRAALVQLSGGARPIAEDSFGLEPVQDHLWEWFGSDGTAGGILNRNASDTTGLVYQLDADPSLSPEELAMNGQILRVTAAPDANRRRTDGLRWIPKVNGQFDVPVVSLHTLGDLFVPFRMQQIYRQRAIDNGSAGWLVQRSIRSPGHCDFTVAELVEAFDALVNWEQHGAKPAGDDVASPAVVAQPRYGCAFTKNEFGRDDAPEVALVRRLLPSC